MVKTSMNTSSDCPPSHRFSVSRRAFPAAGCALKPGPRGNPNQLHLKGNFLLNAIAPNSTVQPRAVGAVVFPPDADPLLHGCLTWGGFCGSFPHPLLLTGTPLQQRHRSRAVCSALPTTTPGTRAALALRTAMRNCSWHRGSVPTQPTASSPLLHSAWPCAAPNECVRAHPASIYITHSFSSKGWFPSKLLLKKMEARCSRCFPRAPIPCASSQHVLAAPMRTALAPRADT